MPHSTRRRAAGPALAAVLTGVALILLATTEHPATCTAVVILGGIAFGLCLIREWLADYARRITDTTTERAELQEAIRQNDAAQAANQRLRERLIARAAELDALTEQKIEEGVAAARREMEAERARMLVDSYEMGALNERKGLHKPGTAAPIGDLIHLADRRRPQPPQAAAGRGITP